MEEYSAKDFSNLLGLKGLSDKMLNNHFKLYQGYVANVNKLQKLLKELFDAGKTGTPEWAEIKRRMGWEFCGMRLHELYFGNMNKEKTELAQDSELMKLMTASFGSGENCHKDFVDTGKMRGIGWVIMFYDPKAKRLFNAWVAEHDMGHYGGCVPLLVMDVWEHAYMTDYELDRASYINAFIEAIDWKVVEERFKAAQQ